MNREKYICIEGCDGSGKTYFIENRLIKLLKDYAMIHEPCNYRSEIKSLLNHITPIIEQNINSLDEIVQITHIMHAAFSMLMSDRYQQHALIESYLNNGINVISDRCILSSYIYQLKLLNRLIQDKKNRSFYKEPKIVTMILDYMFDEIYEFSSNRELMPDRIFILNKTYEKCSSENIDNSIVLQSIIKELYQNIHMDGLCPLSLKKNVIHIDNDIKDEILVNLINK